MNLRRVIWIGAAGLLITLDASAQRNRGNEFRSLNSDQYLLEIQKDGLVDVFLSGSQPVVFDAFPMIWFADQLQPERMRTDGRWTQRYRVEDRLGDGNGMVQKYRSLEWSLRAYPTRPFFAVQAAYTNTGKKPVTVRALMPWCIGDPGKGAVTLGEGTDESVILTEFTRGTPKRVRGEGTSPDAIAVYNLRTGRSFIAGFITQSRASVRFEIGNSKPVEDTAFYRFRAVCEFDPPVTLAPGETLASEVLYLAVAETEPVVGLQRYARAAVVVNTTGPRPEPLRALDAGDFSAIAESLHVVLPEPAPVLLFDDPGTFDAGKVPSGFKGAVWHDLLTHAGQIGTPESNALLTAQTRAIAQSGARTITGIDVDRALSGNTSEDFTRVEAVTSAVRAIREGLGDEGRLYATRPSLLASILMDGVLAPDMTLPSAVAAAALSGGTIVLGEASTPAATRVAATAAALTGSSVLLSTGHVIAEADGPFARAWARSNRSAVPADLFTADSPRVLYMPQENKIGPAHVIAVFNWRDDQTETTTLPLARLGGEPGVFYTVYDFWAEQYRGTAADRLDVTVAPGDVSVLVLRPMLVQPMLLTIGANLAQSSPQIEAYTWDPRNARLRIATRGAQPYSLPLVMPENITPTGVESVSGAVSLSRAAESPRVIRLEVTPDANGVADFVLTFDRR